MQFRTIFFLIKSVSLRREHREKLFQQALCPLFYRFSCQYALINYPVDYQDEKPQNEKSSFDVLTKDFLRSKLCLLYFWTLVQLISLFTPPHITGLQNYFYLLTYLGVFLGNFDNCVTLVTLYVKYVFTFQPDDVENLQIKKLRTKTMVWKILLTIITILLNVLVQLSDDNQGPMVFKLLAKGQIFER